MRRIIKVKVTAVRNVRILVDRHRFELPEGNCIWLVNPSHKFILSAEHFERTGSVALKYIYNKPKELVNWKKEGF